MEKLREEETMPYMTPTDRLFRSDAWREGIELNLQTKFGADGLQLMAEIRQIKDDEERLHAIFRTSCTATSLEEIRRALTPPGL
jgi:hypothetical protein